jgi:hypothetical protein
VICDDGSPARLAAIFLVPLARLLPDGRESQQSPADPGATFTDFSGYYVFKSVQPGIYIARVEKKGYSEALGLILQNLDRFSPPQLQEILSNAPRVTVKSGGTARKDVVIHRGAAISGRVSFDIGGSLGGAGTVTATLVTTSLFDLHDGNEGQRNTLPEFSQSTTPDDRGIYRFSGLPQGKYRIDVRLSEYVPEILWAIKSRERNIFANLKVFAPSALSEARAELVKVDERDELSDIDITIPLGQLHSVSGIVVTNGEPVPSATVVLHSQQGPWYPNEAHPGASTAADGSYRFDLIPAGTYVLEVEEESGDRGVHRVAHRGALTVQVAGSDVSGANIDLRSSSR